MVPPARVCAAGRTLPGAMVLVYWLLLANCNGPARVPDPPRPPGLATLDPEIASEIGRRLDAVEARPSDEQAWMSLATVYHAHGESELAAECYRAVTTLDPEHARAHYLLALVEHRLGRTEVAIDQLERALSLAPDYAPLRLNLGLRLLETGRIDEAMEVLESAAANSGTDAARLGLLARAHLQAGEVDRAAAILEQRLEVDDSDRYAHGLLARAYQRLGRGEEAERHLASGQSESPTWSDPWLDEVERQRAGFSARLERATALLATQPQAAVGLLERLQVERPENSTAAINLGIGLRRTGRLGESAEVLRQAIELDSGRGLAHMHRALTLAEMARQRGASPAGDLDAALEHARTAVELQPTAPQNHAVLAEVLALAGRFDEAVTAYRQALTGRQDRGWNLRLGQLLCRLGRWEQAIEPLEGHVGEDEDAEGLLFLGTARANLGQYALARTALERARELRPHDRRIDAALQQLDAVARAGGSA